jgi:hypothetical protein
MFLEEIREKHPRFDGGSNRVPWDVEQAVSWGIDGGLQPKSLVVYPNHSLLNHNVTRILSVDRR